MEAHTAAGTAAADERRFVALRANLLRWALALGVDAGSAEDLVQDTLLTVCRNLKRFDPRRGTLEGWAAEILVRRLRNRRRAWWRRLRFQEAWSATAPRHAPVSGPAVEARLTIRRLLAALSDRQREVVALYEIADLGAEETARALGITAAGVRSIARDARARLAEVALSPASKEGRS